MATYFNEELKDEINGFVFDPDTFLFTAANEIGTSDRQGVELMFSAHFTAFDLTASYTVIDSTQPDGSGGEVDEVRRPRYMASANLNYAVQERTNINLNVSYNGSQYDLFFPPFPQPFERRKLDGYTLVNLTASYQVTDRVQVYGRIENLFDEQYEDVLGFNTPGIGAFVGVRLGH
jgi:vitamin B12 transporter